MRVSFNINRGDLVNYKNACDAILTKIGNNTRKGTVEACRVISEKSLAQVPRDTETLAYSQYWEVSGYYKTGWNAVIGYGGNGDPVNPKTGLRASEYMVQVHEDLTAFHLIGKAKFLEDPVREFASEYFPRTIFKNVGYALSEFEG